MGQMPTSLLLRGEVCPTLAHIRRFRNRGALRREFASSKKQGGNMSGHSNRRTGISRRTALIGLGLGAGFATAGWSAGAAVDEPVVETTCGKLRGIQQAGVQIFRGVRYGESTAGSRFLPPVAAKPRAGTLDAKLAGNSAPQIPGASYPIAAWYTKIEPVSEDCLFLNVFTLSATQNAKRPVMVWLHGGAWMNCAARLPASIAPVSHVTATWWS
jgi:para-nitrobenzyl esterase